MRRQKNIKMPPEKSFQWPYWQPLLWGKMWVEMFFRWPLLAGKYHWRPTPPVTMHHNDFSFSSYRRLDVAENFPGEIHQQYLAVGKFLGEHYWPRRPPVNVVGNIFDVIRPPVTFRGSLPVAWCHRWISRGTILTARATDDLLVLMFLTT